MLLLSFLLLVDRLSTLRLETSIEGAAVAVVTRATKGQTTSSIVIVIFSWGGHVYERKLGLWEHFIRGV